MAAGSPGRARAPRLLVDDVGAGRRPAAADAAGCLALAVLLCCTPAMPAGAAAGTTPPAATPESTPGGPVARFLPLPHDWVLTYRARIPESPQTERLILEVEHRSPERASLRSGSSVQRVVYARDGARLVTGGYLLRLPLETGASFAGPIGRVVITAVDQLAQVPAGRFAGCLETDENAGSGLASRRILTTYCPDVGIVRFSAESAEGQRHFELESFGPRVDVNAL